MHHLPKMFTSTNEAECEKLLNLDIFKFKKIKHPARYSKFLEKFKEQIKRLAQKEYQEKLKQQQQSKDRKKQPQKQPQQQIPRRN